MEAPTSELAAAEIAAAEKQINFHSPEWRAVETLLGWERYRLSVQILSESDDSQRAKYYGMAAMCKKLIQLAESSRKTLATSSVK